MTNINTSSDNLSIATKSGTSSFQSIRSPVIGWISIGMVPPEIWYLEIYFDKSNLDFLGT